MRTWTIFEYAFGPMGSVLQPEPGVVAVDVGSVCCPGIIDHHQRGKAAACAASLVVERGSELVLGHLEGFGGDRVTILMHQAPDLDCVASTALVQTMLRGEPYTRAHHALADYVEVTASGRPPPDGLNPGSLWGLYLAMCYLEGRNWLAAPETLWRRCLERGLELVDLALDSASAGEVSLPAGEIPGWEAVQAFVGEQVPRFRRDEERARKLAVVLTCPEGGRKSVRGMVVRDPTCAFFKEVARAQGETYLHMIARRADSHPGGRHIISVAPDQGVWLRGLGRRLEAAEIETLASRGTGLPEGEIPRWPDVLRGDPWYDGRSPLHDYTIVDSPRGGTVLEEESVVELALDVEGWAHMGEIAGEKICANGHAFPDTHPGAFCNRCGLRLLPRAVGGRFLVSRKIGSGGNGVVFEATDQEDGEKCALKLLLTPWDTSGKIWHRFAREAEMMQVVRHENLVRLIAYGADPFAGPYIASEYVPGVDLQEDLNDHLSRGESYPWPRMREVLAQTCAGLSAVHAAGVVHRDLKPQNVRISGESTVVQDSEIRVKMLDFGIAIMADPDLPRITRQGRVCGSPDYMAPEQMDDDIQDARCDLYALGSMLYELLAGEPPFAGHTSIMAIMKDKKSGPPDPPVSHPLKNESPDLWRRITALLRRLLDPDPLQRPQSASQVADELRELPLS